MVGPYEVAQIIMAICVLERSEYFDADEKLALRSYLTNRLPPRSVAPSIVDALRGALARNDAAGIEAREARRREPPEEPALPKKGAARMVRRADFPVEGDGDV